MSDVEYAAMIEQARSDVTAHIEASLSDLCADLGWDRRAWLRLSPAGRNRLYREAVGQLRVQIVAVTDAYQKALRKIGEGLTPIARAMSAVARDE